ncbi:hypothetical protein Mapa_000845 [Marchantia paleacea]|nr:hypothetical protein Mapa_000845 [Marchantia paleacea]
MAAVELTLWLLSFIVVAGLLGIVVYQLMCLSDLEFDYINPFDSSSSINKFVVPEFVLQASLCALFLVTGYYGLFLLNLPVVYYHAKLYMNKRHLVDVTEIFNLLGYEKKYRLMKLGFYLLLFFIVIYKLVVAAVLLILEYDTGPDLDM